MLPKFVVIPVFIAKCDKKNSIFYLDLFEKKKNYYKVWQAEEVKILK